MDGAWSMFYSRAAWVEETFLKNSGLKFVSNLFQSQVICQNFVLLLQMLQEPIEKKTVSDGLKKKKIKIKYSFNVIQFPLEIPWRNFPLDKLLSSTYAM